MAKAGGKGGQSRRDAIGGMTQASYARNRGVSRQAIARAVASGRIPVLRRGRIDPRAADRALRANTDPTKLRGARALDAAGARAGKDGKTLYDHKARREQALAELAELELAERRGQLVPEVKVRAAAFRAARNTRDQLLSVPDRLASVLVGRMDQVEIHSILTLEMRRVAQSIAGDEPDPDPPATAPVPPPPAAPGPDAGAGP